MAAWPNFVIVFLTSFCDADNSFNLISPPPLIITQFKTIHFPWKKQHPFLYLQAVSTVRYTGTIVTAFVWSHRSSVLSVMYTMCEKTVAETYEVWGHWRPQMAQKTVLTFVYQFWYNEILRPAFNVILYESQFDLLWPIVIILNNSKNMYNFHF